VCVCVFVCVCAWCVCFICTNSVCVCWCRTLEFAPLCVCIFSVQPGGEILGQASFSLLSNWPLP